MKKWFVAAFCLMFSGAALSPMQGQAVYTATRSSRLAAGVGAMYLNNDYSPRKNGGLAAWVDYDFTRLIGVEAEGRFGGIIGENSYLIGPTVSCRRRKFRVYGKILVGKGTISNQLYNTSSTYNLYELGGGVDYRLTRKFAARVDIGEQKWPDFEPNTLSPLAISVGVMYTIR